MELVSLLISRIVYRAMHAQPRPNYIPVNLIDHSFGIGRPRLSIPSIFTKQTTDDSLTVTHDYLKIPGHRLRMSLRLMDGEDEVLLVERVKFDLEIRSGESP